MVPLVLVASLVDLRPAGTVGSSYVMPTRPGGLEDLRILAGQVTLDLTEYPFSNGTERATLRVGAGSMNVHVPSDVHVEVDARVNGGEAYVLDRYDEGFGFEVAVHEEAGPKDAEKRLYLDMEAGFGTVGVYRIRTGRPDRSRADDGSSPKGRRGDGRDRAKKEAKKERDR